MKGQHFIVVRKLFVAKYARWLVRQLKINNLSLENKQLSCHILTSDGVMFLKGRSCTVLTQTKIAVSTMSCACFNQAVFFSSAAVQCMCLAI